MPCIPNYENLDDEYPMNELSNEIVHEELKTGVLYENETSCTGGHAVQNHQFCKDLTISSSYRRIENC
jgi:heterodisulfide reductase subunit B